jgi:hypothetical protein
LVEPAIVVHTNDSPLRRSLQAPAECKRDDIHLAVMVYETSTDASCLWINHVIEGAPQAAVDPLWSDVIKALRVAGVRAEKGANWSVGSSGIDR